MHGSLRIAVAELSLNENTNQSPGDQGFQERVVSGDTAATLSSKLPRAQGVAVFLRKSLFLSLWLRKL